MSTIVYLDETGDHSLELVDKDFPLFALAMFVCEESTYNQKIVPAVNQFKMDYFGHESIIIHSRDIRKAQKDFGFLTNQQKRKGEVLSLDLKSFHKTKGSDFRQSLLPAGNPQSLVSKFT